MAQQTATLKKYIVTKRMPKALKLGEKPNPNPSWEDQYEILYEIPIEEKVYPPLTGPKEGTEVDFTIPGIGLIKCTALKMKNLGCNNMGYCDNAIFLYVTESYKHLASTPPMPYRCNLHNQKIGLLLIATGKYYQYVDSLINSAMKHMFKGHSLTFFVFTDKFKLANVTNKQAQVKILEWGHYNWPGATLYRYKAFTQYAEQLSQMDFLYYLDVDMKVLAPVGNEVLSELVGTLHPGYTGTKGTPETRKTSTAYIGPNENNKYFAGGFNGGSAAKFLQMAAMLNDRIDEDTNNKIVALHHDESHLNWYFLHNPPTLVLDHSYCYPEDKKKKYPPVPVKRILALDKNHKEMRSA